MWPRVDWAISLGTIVHLVSLLMGLVWAYIKVRERLVAIETKLDPLWLWWTEKAHPRQPTCEELEDDIRALQRIVAARRARS